MRTIALIVSLVLLCIAVFVFGCSVCFRFTPSTQIASLTLTFGAAWLTAHVGFAE